MITRLGAAAAAGILVAAMAHADPPRIVSVEAEKTGMARRISVTLEHPDEGWDHYAAGWRIEDADGKVIAERELLHPHVDEQPFTRSLSSVMLPDGMKTFHVRAKCSVHGWNEQSVAFKLSEVD